MDVDASAMQLCLLVAGVQTVVQYPHFGGQVVVGDPNWYDRIDVWEPYLHV